MVFLFISSTKRKRVLRLDTTSCAFELGLQKFGLYLDEANKRKNLYTISENKASNRKSEKCSESKKTHQMLNGSFVWRASGLCGMIVLSTSCVIFRRLRPHFIWNPNSATRRDWSMQCAHFGDYNGQSKCEKREKKGCLKVCKQLC